MMDQTHGGASLSPKSVDRKPSGGRKDASKQRANNEPAPPLTQLQPLAAEQIRLAELQSYRMLRSMTNDQLGKNFRIFFSVKQIWQRQTK